MGQKPARTVAGGAAFEGFQLSLPRVIFQECIAGRPVGLVVTLECY